RAMAPNVVSYMYNLVQDQYLQHSDPRVQHLPLVGSLWPVLGIIGIYLAFVLQLGPKWMAKRKPYELKLAMQLYNIVQVIANAAIFLYGFKATVLQPDFSLFCQPVDHSNTKPDMLALVYASYGYYMLKYLDLLDTVFIVLRKKNSQVSFLHVYHHGGMVFGVSIYMTFLAGSHCSMLGLINLLVHAVMYGYYFVSSLGAVKELIWWKRHITQLQLLQFGYLTLHFLLVIVRNPCQFPLFIAFIGFTQNIFMFAMFFDFYYKTYMRKARHGTATKSPPS
ncbi:hypothetical protein KR222_005021, partial [Zaprionus bogoriensis]